MLSGLPFRATLRPRQPQPDPGATSTARRSQSTSPHAAASSDSGESDDPDISSLNAQLDVLTTVFPDVQPEVFREMLNSFSEESRLEVVTEAMLRQPDRWVRGRHRTSPLDQKDHDATDNAPRAPHTSDKDARLPVEERFRNETYKLAVKQALYQEFKGLSHSTIRAVLAECNYSYTHARPTLLGLVSKSWRFSVTSFFTRRKPPSAQDHPLVTWQKPDPSIGGALVPRLVPTKSAELNRELYDSLIAPLLRKQNEEMMVEDRALAEQLNEEEAEAAGEMYDCECCFTPSAFEHLSSCDQSGHWICFRCIRFSMNEALYGQGWACSVNTERLTLNCIAPVSDGQCQGCLPQHSVQRALAEERDGEATFRKFEERAITDSLRKSDLPVIQCPFCAYAEVDDVTLPLLSWKPGFRRTLSIWALPAAHFLYLKPIYFLIRFLSLFSFFFVTLNYLLPRRFRIDLVSPLLASRQRVARLRRGLRFTCAHPACGRTSCLACHKAWRDPHVCHESALASLRTHVENAVSNAVKRTCPRCNTSFLKSGGCNKLVCVCGYAMCYVCRQRIAPDEGYQHFCNHFRGNNPGVDNSCDECDKCHLYAEEDVEAVVRDAAKEAEREWKERNGAEGGDSAALAGLSVQQAALLGYHTSGSGGLGNKQMQPRQQEFVGVGKGNEWEMWLDWLMDAVLA
ncbi:Ring finger protein [Lasiodiplodia theobromae]|uniref:Putative E3 ubiquitin-protein ligase ARI1 n=1 Tax=Lasiodiplodia theobromae TaxID=45133 RepID=A0A5N5DSD3_9PEZI|nr:Ring finger protein [Lasiodiplodia theobromae]KAB2580560.1 putative E3 ubiquitin-protein ligase ARI1 [Lasiodiplodia theobromae]KAF4541042.1 Ring finger protein [Lasiodiplodia theobromae]